MRIAFPDRGRRQPPFVGRQRERAWLLAELGRGASLITLAGPSGIGKTRLALQTAGELLDVFEREGGVWLCDLTGCRDTADFEAAVARALEIQQHDGDQLISALANRGPLLLVLDNANQLARAIGGVVDRWLHRCVELQMIVTSLLPLGLADETLLELRALELDDAVTLYLEVAQRAWADRSFCGDDAADIRDLVRRLDQHPLAIELAASRSRTLPPRTMLSMLERRFEILRVAANQQGSSLLGALELTWNHLEPEEQAALAMVSVFEGGFTADAASALLLPALPENRASAPRQPGIDPLLEGLVRKALLQQDEARVGAPRYFLFDSIREFALRELDEMGRRGEAIRRHARFYLDQPPARPAPSVVFGRMDAIPWLKEERANLLAIHHRFFEADPAVAARAGLALAPLLLQEDNSRASSSIIDSTLAAAKRSGARHLITGAMEAAYSFLLRRGDFEDAIAAAQEAVTFARSAADKEAEALALSHLAAIHLDQRKLESSGPLLRRADQLSRELRLPHVEGYIRLCLGFEALILERLAEAKVHLLRSIELLRRHGPHGSEINSLHALGLTLANQNEHLAAREVIHGAIDLSRAHHHRAFEAFFQFNLASIELAAGHLDEAEAAGNESLRINRQMGNRYREGLILCVLGAMHLERGDLDRAIASLSRAEELLRAPATKKAHAEVLAFLAVAEAKRTRLEDARRALDDLRAHVHEGVTSLSPAFVEGLESLLDLSSARYLSAETPRDAIEAKIIRARSGLRALRAERGRWQNYLPVLTRLLAKELADWDVGVPASSDPLPVHTLMVGEGSASFRLLGDKPVSLRNRRVLRKIFEALVQARLDSPGGAIGPQDLIDKTWPGAEADPGSMRVRLRVAIWTLRDLGLREVILNREEGYLLDPEVPIRFE